MSTRNYRGRFAPSPTGPLHWGSLLSAVSSYFEARSQQGEWLLRIEDIDPPREVPGSANDILHTLELYGLIWDKEVIYQSHRHERYAEALHHLRPHLYRCICSRREIENATPSRAEGAIYPGTCRDRHLDRGAWRIRVTPTEIVFEDAIQGIIHQPLQQTGDFVLQRADHYYAYQLAVVVDDAEAGITHVVRGADLLGATARQIFLQQQLGYPTPGYAHIPVAVNAAGQKLSKQTQAQALSEKHPQLTLWQALYTLGQHPPTELRGASIAELHAWANVHWQLKHIPRYLTLESPSASVTTGS